MFNTAAATSHASSACDRPILHHSHSDSNCHRLYHQQKRFQKRHSATSFGPTSTTRWSLQPQPQEVLCKSFPNPSYSASSSTAHGIFHEHDHYTTTTTNHHQHHYRHHQQHVWAGATGSGSGPPKTRGLFRRVTRKVIEWIRGSIVPGAKQVTAIGLLIGV